MCGVPDVIVVLVSPSSVVTKSFRNVSLDSDWECVEPQSSSLPKKRAYVWTVSQGGLRYESSLVIEPPLSRRRMVPPTPQQSSHSSIGAVANRGGGPKFGMRVTERSVQE